MCAELLLGILRVGGMLMSSSDTIDKINSYLKFGMKPGLERIRELLCRIGNPQDKLKFIHIAGTNGKGSTSSFIHSVLKDKGYRVGLFTSPFIIDFRERIQINGEMISKTELDNTFSFIEKVVDEMSEEGKVITEFELITAIAFKYFYDQNCDIVVLETGLGGKFDSTNIISNPLVSVITHIDLDHMNILGDSLSKIAYQKAGIIKEGSITVMYPDQDKEALEVIRGVALKKNNKFIMPNMEDIKILSCDIDKMIFTYKGEDYSIHLLGKHQVKNAVTAIETINSLRKLGIEIEIQSVKNGLVNTKIPARLEVISKEPLIILDGCHNPDSANALKNVIMNDLHLENNIAVIGMLRDKDIKKTLSILSPCFKKVVTSNINNPRAASSKEFATLGKDYFEFVYESCDVDDALEKAFSLVKKDGSNLIILGSLYLCAEVRKKLIIN